MVRKASQQKSPVRRKTSPKRKSPPRRKTSPKRKSPPRRKTSPKRKSPVRRKTSPKRKSPPRRKTSPKRKIQQRGGKPSPAHYGKIFLESDNETIPLTVSYGISEPRSYLFDKRELDKAIDSAENSDLKDYLKFLKKEQSTNLTKVKKMLTNETPVGVSVKHIEEQDEEGYTAVMRDIIERRHTNIGNAKVIDPNLQSNEKKTVLMYAIENARNKNVHDLALKIARMPNLDPNVVDESGEDALLKAIGIDLLDLAWVLAKNPNLNPHTKDNIYGLTALDLAVDEYDDLAKLLVNHPKFDIDMLDSEDNEDTYNFAIQNLKE